MSALPLPENVYKLPKRRPKIVEKVAPPDQRKFCVVPMRAALDTELHGFSMRVLVVLCSYCNRAGLTWVGQQRIADHLKTSKQQVARAMKQLRDRGHVEVVSKGFRGEKANTVRVVFAEDISAQDAIALASSIEDSRPPEQVRREAKEMTEPEPDFTPEQMAENRKRLKELLGGLADRRGFHYNRPERLDDIMARKPRAKKANIDNTEVVHETPIIDNIIDNTGVVQSQKTISIDKVLGIYKDKVINRFSYDRTTIVAEVDIRFAELLCQVGCSEARFADACQALTKPMRLGEICEALIG